MSYHEKMVAELTAKVNELVDSLNFIANQSRSKPIANARELV